jgi:hypothetical protein
MHNKISGRLALEIIFLLSFLVGSYAIIGSGILWPSDNVQNVPSIKAENKAIASDNSCRTHAFEGEAKIHGWYVNEENDWILVISDEDMKNLPNYDGSEEYKLKNKRIKLVDADSSIEKKLRATSEKKPMTIKITGYAIPCDGIPLATIDYKEGIFKKFMNI